MGIDINICRADAICSDCPCSRHQCIIKKEASLNRRTERNNIKTVKNEIKITEKKYRNGQIISEKNSEEKKENKSEDKK